jgi:hypothetical protein
MITNNKNCLGEFVCDSDAWYGQECACIDCRPVNFCVEDRCSHCEGPTKERCIPPNLDPDFETDQG